jgi:hypothetical protein
VSIENARHTWRADVLREIPAAVRFISAEPLLGSLYPERCDARCFPAEGSYLCGREKGHAGLHRSEYEYRPGQPAGAEWDDSTWWVGRNTVGTYAKPLDLTGIDWIIVGGESGPGARPFHLEHAREIVRACLYHCVDCAAEERPRLPAVRPAVFVKQLGARPSIDELEFGLIHKVVTGPDAGRGNGPFQLGLRDRKGGDWDEWPADLRIREFPRSAA